MYKGRILAMKQTIADKNLSHQIKKLLNIAQIAPLSFQDAVAHKPRQVRWGELHASVVTEWSPACLHK